MQDRENEHCMLVCGIMCSVNLILRKSLNYGSEYKRILHLTMEEESLKNQRL